MVFVVSSVSVVYVLFSWASIFGYLLKCFSCLLTLLVFLYVFNLLILITNHLLILFISLTLILSI